MKIEELVPPLGDRVFIAGQTGSGKTTLARALLKARQFVVVLDTKGTIKWRDYTLFKSYSKLVNADPLEHPRIVYRPPFEDTQNEGLIDAFFKWVYRRGNTIVYVDELSSISRGDNYPYHYGACLSRGRELGVDVWSGTQRPTRIPQISMSEAEHVYCGRLRMPQDRKRVEDLTAIPSERIAGLSKRQFLYAPQDGEILGPLTLLLTD